MTVMLLYHGYLSDEGHQSWQEAARRSDVWVAGDRFQGAPMRVGGEGKPEPAGLWGYDLLQLDTLDEAVEWAELLLQAEGGDPPHGSPLDSGTHTRMAEGGDPPHGSPLDSGTKSRAGPGPSVEIHRIYDPGELTPRMELASNA